MVYQYLNELCPCCSNYLLNCLLIDEEECTNYFDVVYYCKDCDMFFSWQTVISQRLEIIDESCFLGLEKYVVNYLGG